MKLFPLLVLSCLFPGMFLLAQTSPTDIKFGKISKADRALMSVPGDSTAEAYVLHDLLSLRIEPNPDGQPILSEYRHRRVKLLTDASFDRADIELTYYTETENIYGIKAMIHFPDGSSEKISKRSIIREKYNDEYDVYKFTFPGVREGAVLEYSYTKSDKNIVVPSRYFFQENIPVRYAEYKALIPSMFDYVSLSSGRNQYYYEQNKVENNLYGGNQIRHNSIRWVMKDLSAHDEQPYMNNFSDYIPQVRLQLKAVTYPGQASQKVFTSWKQTTEKMYEWPSFGRAFNNRINSNKVFRDVEPLLAKATTETEKASIIYNFVTSRITWDGDYGWTSDLTPNKVYEAATGDSGEMGILLLALLKQAGLDAKPVLVPLRDYGAPIEIYPLVTQFNHLMVLATLDGKTMFLDPNTPRRPMGLPRSVALNQRVFLADEERPRWINIKGKKASQVVQANLVLDEEGMAAVDLTGRMGSYFALNGRNAIAEMEEDSEFPLMEDILELFPDAELVSKSVKDEEVKSGPLNFDLNITAPIGQAVDDYLYVQPILCPVFEKNLADVEKRIYPVDFAYPFEQRYIAKITLPDGFVVEEMPKSRRVVSEDRTMVCTFSSEEQADKTILVRFDVSVKNTFYPSTGYAALRGMFRIIIEAQESTLVLKRAK